MRHSSQRPHEVTGYAVALPGDRTAAGNEIWYVGGRLAPDLTLPQLRARWSGDAVTSTRGPILDDEARRAAWKAARRAATEAAQGRPASARTAEDAGALLRALAGTAEGRRDGVLNTAADRFDRAAREPHRQPEQPTHSGSSRGCRTGADPTRGSCRATRGRRSGCRHGPAAVRAASNDR